ncbi:MAG: PEP-CTERM sorting domain-containing protein [Bryobacteraceae bacterium]|nr:PEP-CTERM sorting domain-containing protein [Bryobacteraceae bacterium]
MFTRAAILAFVFVFVESLALGAFTAVSSPDTTYHTNTTLLPIGAAGFTPVSSLFDSGLTVNFSSQGVVTSAPAVWSIWSVAPESESSGGSVPLIAFTVGTFVMSFSAPVSTFGVEIQPDVLNEAVPVTATFFRGSTQVGQITRNLTTTTTAGGARIFAGTSLDQPFTSLQLSFGSQASSGNLFGLAYFRYTLAPQSSVPEPATMWILASGLAALAFRRRAARL